jgi:hypothetical protein
LAAEGDEFGDEDGLLTLRGCGMKDGAEAEAERGVLLPEAVPVGAPRCFGDATGIIEGLGTD